MNSFAAQFFAEVAVTLFVYQQSQYAIWVHLSYIGPIRVFRFLWDSFESPLINVYFHLRHSDYFALQFSKTTFFSPNISLHTINFTPKLVEICYNMPYHTNIILHIHVHTCLYSKSNSLASWYSQPQWQENGKYFTVIQQKRKESFNRHNWEQTGSTASKNNLVSFYLPFT